MTWLLNLITPKNLVVLAVVTFLAIGVIWFKGVLADRDKYLARAEAAEEKAEAAEEKIEEMAEANKSLEKANEGCNQAAKAQGAASVAAMARREELAGIMASPAPGPDPGPVATGTKGVPLNDVQDRQMVVFYNNLFSGLGGLRVN